MKITNSITDSSYKKAFNIVYLQLGCVLLIAIAWLCGKDMQAAYSTLLGGAAWLFPNWFFIRKFFKHKKARSLNAIAKDFFLGEFLKFFLSAALIILFLKIFPVNLIAFLSGFIGAVMTSLFMPIIFTATNK